MLFTDKKHGSLHYFAFHSAFFKKVTFKVDFLSMFEGFLCTCLEADWPSEKTLCDHTRAGTPLLTLHPTTTRWMWLYQKQGFFPHCVLHWSGSLSGGHLDDSKVFHSSSSKDIFQPLNSPQRRDFKEMSVTVENIARCSFCLFWSPPVRKMLQTTDTHVRNMKDIQCYGLGHKTFVRIWILLHYVLMVYFIFVLKQKYTSKKGKSESKWPR